MKNASFYNSMGAPHILRETSAGYNCYRIQDEMLSKRKIQCVGEITGDYTNELIMQLLYLQEQDAEEEITIYINSPGGSVDAGMALYDVMKAVTCPIRTVCIGLAASMGALLFASGDTREMLPHSRIMIHDPLISNTGGSALRIKSVCDDLMETREIIAKVLAEHTGKTIEEIYQCTASDTFFRAEAAVEFGLADHIITTLR